MRCIFLAVLAVLAGNACGHTSKVVATSMVAASNPEVLQLLSSGSPIRVELAPSVPSRLAPGDEVLLALEARFDSGLPCRFCRASWASDAPRVASIATDRACTRGRCRVVLRALGAGETKLTLKVCQSYENDCREWKFPLRVR